MSRSEILAVSGQQRPSETKWGYAESTQKRPFHNHHQPFRRTVIVFWARTPPATISQSRLLFLEFSTFSRSCSNLISFPSYDSCVFLMFLNKVIIQCLSKVQNTHSHTFISPYRDQPVVAFMVFNLQTTTWPSQILSDWFVLNGLKSEFFSLRTDFDFEVWQ